MTSAAIGNTPGLLTRALLPMQGDVEIRESWSSFLIKAEKPDVLLNCKCSIVPKFY